MAKGSTPKPHQVEHSKDPWLPWEEAAQDVEGTGVSRERRGDKHGDRGTPPSALGALTQAYTQESPTEQAGVPHTHSLTRPGTRGAQKVLGSKWVLRQQRSTRGGQGAASRLISTRLQCPYLSTPHPYTPTPVHPYPHGLCTCPHLSTQHRAHPCRRHRGGSQESWSPAASLSHSRTPPPPTRSGRLCTFSCALVKITHHAFLCQTGSPDAGAAGRRLSSPTRRGAWLRFPHTHQRGKSVRGTGLEAPRLRCQICLMSWLGLKSSPPLPPHRLPRISQPPAPHNLSILKIRALASSDEPSFNAKK